MSYIDTMKSIISAIKSKALSVRADNRAHAPTESIVDRSAAFDQVLSINHSQEELIKETARWYSLKTNDTSLLQSTFEKMIPTIKKC